MRETIVAFSKRIIKHELINGSFFILLGSMAGNIFSFIFNLFLARNLSYADYGIVTALISFVGLIVIPTQSITTVLVQYATNFFSKKEISKASSLYKKSYRVLSIVSIGVLILFILFSQGISNYLHIEQFSYVVVVGILVSLSYISVINVAFIQSLLRFGFLSFLSFIGSLSKVVFGILFVFLGFKALGVLGGFVMASLISFVIGFFPLRSLLLKEEKEIAISWDGMISYAITVAVVTFSLSSFTSTDIILVKHFFNPSQAGLYAGLSLVGKAIFYLTAPISTVLFPVIINRFNQGRNFQKTFYLALGLVLLPSFAATAFYFLFPEFTIQLFLGGRGYLQLSSVLWIYALFITVFSLLNVCVTLFLSLKKTGIFLPLAGGALIQFIAINIYHKDFRQVILVSLFTSSILLILILLYYLKTYGQKKNSA